MRKLKSLNNLHLENALFKASQQETKDNDSLPGKEPANFIVASIKWCFGHHFKVK